jgi:uncharacterized membrane protein YfcA
MNPFSSVAWFWRACRTRSITAAALFALALMGISVLAGFRHLLSELGAPWFLWLLLPLAVVAAIARKEAEWMPDEAERRRWSRRIVVGAIVLALVAAKFGASEDPDHAPTSSPTTPASGRADPHGR